jgi:hypothetical protein
MPYVTKDKRPDLDKVVEEMAEARVVANGDLNYILFAYCKRHVTPSYNNYKNFLGELNEAAEEIRRRLLADYEDKKIIENGDVD